MVGGLPLNFLHRRHQRFRPCAVADPPTGHRIGLGNAVHGQCALVQFRNHRGEGLEFDGPVGEHFVNVIGQHQHLRMSFEDCAQTRQVHRAVHHPGGIRGRVEQQPACSRCDRLLQCLRSEPKPLLWFGVHKHRLPAKQANNVRVADPIRCRNDDLIVCVQCGHHHIENDLLAAHSNQHLIRRVVQPVVPLELCGNRLPQLRNALRCRVACFAPVDGTFRGIPDVLRGLKIRFACCEGNDVPALGLEFPCPGADRHGGRDPDLCEPGGKFHSYRWVGVSILRNPLFKQPVPDRNQLPVGQGSDCCGTTPAGCRQWDGCSPSCSSGR